MYRFTITTRSILNNIRKLNVLSNHISCISLPLNVRNVQRAFYCKDSTIKSPLGNLIRKESQSDGQQERNQQQEDSKENREQSWKRMKITLIVFGVSFACFGAYLLIELGKPRISEDGRIIEDEYSTMPLMKQYLLRTINELNYYKQLIREPSRDKLLPDMIKHPYYAPKYTLVLEFTDVLVHPEWTYNTGWRFKKRPGLDHFLESLSGVYEIVVYTAEQGMTVFPIIEALDPKNHINYKLVRDATLFIDGRHVKDLSKLNRNLERTIIVDWDGTSTKYHPDNVFRIPRWKGNDDDLTLIHLSSFLLAISSNQIDDVREVIKYYNQFDDPLNMFRERQKQLLEMAESKVDDGKKEQQTPVVKKWTPSFLKSRH